MSAIFQIACDDCPAFDSVPDSIVPPVEERWASSALRELGWSHLSESPGHVVRTLKNGKAHLLQAVARRVA